MTSKIQKKSFLRVTMIFMFVFLIIALAAGCSNKKKIQADIQTAIDISKTDTPLDFIGDAAQKINIYGDDTDIDALKKDIDGSIDKCDKKIKEVNDWNPESKVGQELKADILKCFNNSKLSLITFSSSLNSKNMKNIKDSLADNGGAITTSYKELISKVEQASESNK